MPAPLQWQARSGVGERSRMASRAFYRSEGAGEPISDGAGGLEADGEVRRPADAGGAATGEELAVLLDDHPGPEGARPAGASDSPTLVLTGDDSGVGAVEVVVARAR